MSSRRSHCKWTKAIALGVTFALRLSVISSARDDLDEMISWDLYKSGGLFTEVDRIEMWKTVKDVLTRDPYETNRRLIKLVSRVPLMSDVIYVSPIRFTIRQDPQGAYAVLRSYLERFDEDERNAIHYTEEVLARTKANAEQWIEFHPWLENEKRMEEIILSDDEMKQDSWLIIAEALACAYLGDLNARKIGPIQYIRYTNSIRDNAPWISWFLYDAIQEYTVGQLEVLPIFRLMEQNAPECIAPIARHYRANLIFRGAILYEELQKLSESKHYAMWLSQHGKLYQILQRLEDLDEYKKHNPELFVDGKPEISIGTAYPRLIEEAFRKYRSNRVPSSVRMEAGDA